MGTYYYWANLDKKQWFDPDETEDNIKWPIGNSAHAVFLLLSGHSEWQQPKVPSWHGDRIAVFWDTGDLPWQDDRRAWTDISATVRAWVKEWEEEEKEEATREKDYEDST